MGKYTFALDKFEITNTRSRHEDTDTATFGIAINNSTPVLRTQFMGDLNNGTYPTNQLRIDADVADDGPNTDAVLVMYYIVNAGDSSVGRQAAETLVGKALAAGGKALVTAAVNNVISPEGEAAIASAIGGAIGTVWPGLGNLLGALAGATVGYVWGLLTANCDGPVAFAARAYTGAQLKSMTTAGPLTGRDDFPGLESAHGCGSNSRYYSTFSIRTDVASQGGGGGGSGGGGGCVGPHTLVLMADGSQREIDEVVPGDVVMSQDSKTGAYTSRHVKRVNRFAAPETVSVHLSNGEELHVTPGHRFFEPSGELTEAHKTNERSLECHGGSPITVTHVVKHPEGMAVYSLDLDRGEHTGDRYFIGRAKTLVHHLKN